MELLIKIPKDIKGIIDRNGTNEIITETLWQAVKNGIPLPKGHGRLIDADVLADGFEDNYEFCEEVNATPTIIEADKENKE